MKFRLVAATIGLLLLSNTFMTYAWYGHLKNLEQPVWRAILTSWGIALFEYCFMVPANRIGYGTMNAAQLKVLQEVITLLVFVVFAWRVLGEPPTAKTWIGFGLIAAGAAFIFQK